VRAMNSCGLWQDVQSEQSSVGTSSQSTSLVYEKEAKMEIDYRKLPSDLKVGCHILSFSFGHRPIFLMAEKN